MSDCTLLPDQSSFAVFNDEHDIEKVEVASVFWKQCKQCGLLPYANFSTHWCHVTFTNKCFPTTLVSQNTHTVS